MKDIKVAKFGILVLLLALIGGACSSDEGEHGDSARDAHTGRAERGSGRGVDSDHRTAAAGAARVVRVM